MTSSANAADYQGRVADGKCVVATIQLFSGVLDLDMHVVRGTNFTSRDVLIWRSRVNCDRSSCDAIITRAIGGKIVKIYHTDHEKYYIYMQ